MQKISKQLTTFIDHRRKRESLRLKKFKKKDNGNIISKKEIWGSLKLKFSSLFLKIKKHQQEKRFSLIYRERVTSLVSEMHLCVLVETQQIQKVDLNWTCLFCSYGNGTVRLRTGLISDSFFPTTRILDLFWTGSLDFLCECNLSPFRLFGTDQSVPVCSGTHGRVNGVY